MATTRSVKWLLVFSLLVACSGSKAPEPRVAAPSSPPPTADAGAKPPAPANGTPPVDAALLHRSSIVVDTHNDVTQRLVMDNVDLGTRLPDGQTDIPRMREGGLDAEFLSVWVAPQMYPGEKAYAYALEQFDAIDRLVSKNAKDVVLARSSTEVRNAAAAGKIAFLIGVEGAHSLGDAPDDQLVARLRQFYGRGARYMTLTWSNSNRLGGSSGDDGKDRGLTPFGLRIVSTMNELGMIVDISHVSDQAFFDAVKASKKPVLASHSSSRALTAHPRNMTDDMLRAVRDNGGAVCVNFGPEFLDAAWHERWAAEGKSMGADIAAMAKANGGNPKATQLAIWKKFQERATHMPPVPATRVIENIQHMVQVAGVDHVCLGSDFDGIPVGPAGLDDVSKLPFITEALLRVGFSADDIRKILGENVLRVLSANEPTSPSAAH